MYLAREQVYPDFIQMINSDCTKEGLDFFCECLISSAGFESIKEIVNIRG